MSTSMKKGFGLIEVILYTVLISIFVTAVVSYGISLIRIREKAAVEQKVVAAARFLVRRINYEIRNSALVNTAGSGSLSLSYSDSQRDPTVIDLHQGRVRIGYGNSGDCPVTTPCFLSPSDVEVQSLVFNNMGDGGDLSDSVKYELVLKTQEGVTGLNWFFKYYSTSSAEVRSK